MNEIINKLAELFRQRNQIDDLIEKTIGFMHAVDEEAQKPKKENKPSGKRNYKPRKKRSKEGGILRKYRCNECALGFESDADYRDVRCPACVSKNVLSLPSGSGEDE